MRPAAPASEALDRAIVAAPLLVAPDASVATAAALMAAAAAKPHPHAAARASCVLVVAPGAPPALLAAGDVVRLVAQGAPPDTTPVGAVAAPARCLRRSAFVQSSAALALLGDAGHLVLLDDADGIAGLVTPASLLAAQAVPPRLFPPSDKRPADESGPEQAYARGLLEILDAVDALFVSVAGNGRVTFMNRTARALLGFAPDEDVTMVHVVSLHTPDYNERIQREIIPQVAASGSWEGESSFVSREGTLIPVRQVIVAHFALNGALTHLSSIAHDLRERRQVEESLRESEERLRLALMAANQGLYDLDLPARQVLVSPEYATMLGYDPATFHETEEGLFERMHPDDVEGTVAAFEAYLAGTSPTFSAEFRQRTRDGTWKWILSLGNIVSWDAAGRPLRMIGTHTDITPRKEAAEALRELNQELERRVAERTAALHASQERLRRSEAHLLAAQRIAALGSWELEVATGAIIWSEETYHIFGRDPALGPPSFDELQAHVVPEDREPHRLALDRALVSGDPYTIELRFHRADGERRICQARGLPVRDEQGALIRLVGTVLDITDRRRTEQQLRNLADRLALAAKSAALGIWDWDLVADVLTWDERMYELYGLAPDTFGGAYRAWAHGLHPDDRAEAELAIRRALEGEQEFDTEFRVRQPDGAVRVIKAFGLVQRGPGGEPLRMIGINYDSTERRQAEDQLRATGAQLAAANHELQAFAYSVSHDLRAPLRAIDGFSQALVEDYDHLLDAEARAYLARIRGGVRRMSQLIDDLLQLSRVSRAAMSQGWVDLSAVVARTCAELRESDPGREVEVVIAPGVSAWGDANLLRVALDNLLANAWKFTSRRERARIEFGVTRAGNQKVYFVRDDGVGYDPAYANKLFGVFQRLHDTNEFPGTGIGLATVQRVVHRHGGQVWSEGAVEQGATFFFTLPGGRLGEER